MEYQYYDGNAYNLHMFKTDKFKTITIMVAFRRKIKKNEVTIRRFVHPILLLSSKNFPSSRLITMEMERLYGPYIGANENRVGNYSITQFHMTMVNDSYTESGLNDKCMDFFKEVLFNPDIDENGFNKKSFNIVKNEVRASLKSIKDNPKYYSMIRMLEHLAPKSPISYRNGYLDDLDEIDEVKVYDYYKSMLHSDLVDIYVLGDIDFNKMKNKIIDMIPINTIKRQKGDIYINHETLPKRIKKFDDVEQVSQAKLVIGCKIGSLSDFESKYVLPIYNDILGGPGYSKLFQSVREKNSLSYYVYSNYRRADNILTVSSGINKESYDKALKLIRAEFDNMAKGNISEDELNKAKEDRLSIIKSIEDNALHLINNNMWQIIYNLDDLETRKKKLLKVKLDDIKNISKKIQMDTVYLLHGGD